MDRRAAQASRLFAHGMPWFGLVAGPLAWALDQQVSYALVPWSCNTDHHGLIHLVGVATLLLAGGGAVVAAHAWRRARGVGTDGQTQFVALLGLLLCLLFGLVVLVDELAKFYFDPCQR